MVSPASARIRPSRGCLFCSHHVRAGRNVLANAQASHGMGADDRMPEDASFMLELSVLNGKYKQPSKAQRAILEMGWNVRSGQVRFPERNV
jgi:hypothetical protein